jgi:hypothetical protein
MVLVFSELNCFVRTILQAEENKGVEFTGAAEILEGRRIREEGLTVDS